VHSVRTVASLFGSAKVLLEKDKIAAVLRLISSCFLASFGFFASLLKNA